MMEENTRKKTEMKRSLQSSSARQMASKKQCLQTWCRKSAPLLDPSEALLFQQTSIEWSMDENQKPVIHIYGITEEGNSVLCHVHGFLPYAFIAIPEKDLLDHLGEDCSVFEKCELVRRRNLYGYNEEETFAKVTLTNPYQLAKLSDVVKGYQIFESNLDFVLRFMVDMKIVGMNWIGLPADSYDIHLQDPSHCQYEVDVRYDQIISHSPVDRMSSIAPLRILSFDIECTGLDYRTNKVIQIANIISVHGEKEPRAKVIFTLGGCSKIDGAVVRSFEDERSLLMAWKDFIIEADPDIFTGYNINGFDFPFLIERANLLNLKRFPYFGRNEKTRCQVRAKETTTKAYGTRKTMVVDIPGRTSLDVCEIIRRDHKLPSYKLNDVSDHFLQGEKKIDLPYREMFKLQEGSDNDRRRIAEYCLKDAELPLLLMDKLMCIPNYIEMARVTGVPLSYLSTRGQQIKVLSQIYRRAKTEGYIVPVLESSQLDDDEGYEGATVIEPVKGFYDIPIATLDFNSLYPSIMMAHNLCYTTFLTKDVIKSQGFIKDKDYFITPDGNAFLFPSRRNGLLPGILKDLIAARKIAKADLKKETDPFRRAVLDGRQLALKIVANSVYGFSGAQKGYLPCQQIASSVTAFGREMIDITRELVEKKYTMANGYQYDAQVIYGDTDSVMIKFGDMDLAKVMKLSKEAALYVTDHFKHPINLEFEKAYFPFLLIGKKQYAGLYWTNPHKYDKVDVKGIAIVRRDRCGLVQEIMKACLNAILVDRDVDKAISTVHQALRNLLQDNVDMALLTFTGGWGKSKYAIVPPHVAVAYRMMERDPDIEIGVGDRIAYVVTAGLKHSSVSIRAEDPAYVRAMKLPIDVDYYRTQLKKPLIDIFSPILGSDDIAGVVLFTGDHMNHVVQARITLPPAFAGFVVTKRCKRCKNPMNGGKCDNC